MNTISHCLGDSLSPAPRCCSHHNSLSSGVRLTIAPIVGFTFVYVTYPALLSVPTFSIPFYLSSGFPLLSHPSTSLSPSPFVAVCVFLSSLPSLPPGQLLSFTAVHLPFYLLMLASKIPLFVRTIRAGNCKLLTSDQQCANETSMCFA